MDAEGGGQDQPENNTPPATVDTEIPHGLLTLLTAALDSPLSSPATPPQEPTGVIWRFHPGRVPTQVRMRPARLPLARQRRHPPSSPMPSPSQEPFLWVDRIKLAPKPGHIRPLTDPDTAPTPMIRFWWSRDRTLTEWVDEINSVTSGRINSELVRAAYPSDYEEQCWSTLQRIQHERWLARKVIAKMRHRIWMKRTQCNIDLIDMEPVSDRDAVHVTDVKHKMIYRFHRRDLFINLISNITSSDEMLPNPRPPTNPYTNAPLTLGQTIAVCQALLTDYAARGRCPPVLFAAFCNNGYDIDRFVKKNSSLLAQYAIQAFFKDITPHNLDTITDTMMQLLSEAGVDYAPMTVRRWLRQTPSTPLHREWLAMARDYTLYMNLHIQTRDTWYSESYIHADVRRLYDRTPLPESTSSRVRSLRTLFHDTPGPRLPGTVSPGALPFSVQALLGIPPPPLTATPLISAVDDMTDAMALIRMTLFGTDLLPQNRPTNQNNEHGRGPSP
jgi:hypothetical protein